MYCPTGTLSPAIDCALSAVSVNSFETASYEEIIGINSNYVNSNSNYALNGGGVVPIITMSSKSEFVTGSALLQ